MNPYYQDDSVTIYREEAEQMLAENPDVVLVAELSRKYPTTTVPFLAELVEFVRCWEPPNERDQDGVCQYCLGVGCEKCDARFLARCRDEIVGPYCALCGQCKACSDRGAQPDYGCYDRVEVDGTRAHLWPAGSPEPIHPQRKKRRMT